MSTQGPEIPPMLDAQGPDPERLQQEIDKRLAGMERDISGLRNALKGLGYNGGTMSDYYYGKVNALEEQVGAAQLEHQGNPEALLLALGALRVTLTNYQRSKWPDDEPGRQSEDDPPSSFM